MPTPTITGSGSGEERALPPPVAPVVPPQAASSGRSRAANHRIDLIPSLLVSSESSSVSSESSSAVPGAGIPAASPEPVEQEVGDAAGDLLAGQLALRPVPAVDLGAGGERDHDRELGVADAEDPLGAGPAHDLPHPSLVAVALGDEPLQLLAPQGVEVLTEQAHLGPLHVQPEVVLQ